MSEDVDRDAIMDSAIAAERARIRAAVKALAATTIENEFGGVVAFNVVSQNAILSIIGPAQDADDGAERPTRVGALRAEKLALSRLYAQVATRLAEDRAVHLIAGQGVAVCGVEVGDPCEDCRQAMDPKDSG